MKKLTLSFLFFLPSFFILAQEAPDKGSWNQEHVDFFLRYIPKKGFIKKDSSHFEFSLSPDEKLYVSQEGLIGMKIDDLEFWIFPQEITDYKGNIVDGRYFHLQPSYLVAKAKTKAKEYLAYVYDEMPDRMQHVLEGRDELSLMVQEMVSFFQAEQYYVVDEHDGETYYQYSNGDTTFILKMLSEEIRLSMNVGDVQGKSDFAFRWYLYEPAQYGTWGFCKTCKDFGKIKDHDSGEAALRNTYSVFKIVKS